MKISSKHLHSQTVRARELNFFETVHLPPPVMCNVSHVTCHMSCVTFHMSHVMCHISCVICTFSHFLLNFFGQSFEASRWRVCYQRGLLRLVFFYHISTKCILALVVKSSTLKLKFSPSPHPTSKIKS